MEINKYYQERQKQIQKLRDGVASARDNNPNSFGSQESLAQVGQMCMEQSPDELAFQEEVLQAFEKSVEDRKPRSC